MKSTKQKKIEQLEAQVESLRTSLSMQCNIISTIWPMLSAEQRKIALNEDRKYHRLFYSK